MKNLIRFLALSLVVTTSVVTPVLARPITSHIESDSDVVTSVGSFTNLTSLQYHKEISTEAGSFTNLRDEGVEIKKEAKSYLNTLGGYAYEGAKYVGQTTLNVGLSTAESMARYGLAYYAAYASVKTLEEVTALGAYCGAYGIVSYSAGPIAASAAANASYNIAKMAMTTARYVVPGYEGAIAATYLVPVKAVTDTAINWTPTVLKAGASVAKSGFSATKAISNTIWNYFNA